MTVILHPSDPRFGERLAKARAALTEDVVARWTAFNAGLKALSQDYGIHLAIASFEMDGVPDAAEHWAVLVAAEMQERDEQKRRGNGHGE